MSDLIIPELITKEDRMKAFQADLRALDELATTVHQKAVEGDNAAGHLDLKIRERKARMFGYDSPTRFDMVMVGQLERPSSTDLLERALAAVAGISEESAQRGYLPEPEVEPEPSAEQ